MRGLTRNMLPLLRSIGPMRKTPGVWGLAPIAGVGVSPRMVTICPDPIENVTMRGLTLNTGGDQDEALGDAIDDPAQRDAAYDALKTFMKELKGTARGALRAKPGLLAKLEL